jgi:hypothetical protein
MIMNALKTFGKNLMGVGSFREARTVSGYFDDVAGVLSKQTNEDKDFMMQVLRGEKTAADLGLGEDTGKVLSSVSERFKEGQLSTNEAVGAMYKNVQDTGEVFGGLSTAGQTKSQALGFGAFGNPDNIIGSAAMGAFVGAGASSITGGDTTEGAFIGGMVGMGGSVGAKAFRESLGAIEESVMKKALGSEFKTKDMILQEGTYMKAKKPFTRIDDEISLKNNKVVSASSPRGETILNKATFTRNETLSARNQNLDAISKIDLKDAPDNLNFIDKQVIKNMQSKDSASMGVQSRFATISGAALAGMAFTSSAGSDKRRGFNRNRGNRI